MATEDLKEILDGLKDLMPESLTPRQFALMAATLHHGLSNLNPKAIPANKQTVINTADSFELFLIRPASVRTVAVVPPGMIPRPTS
jgi:hypothetical protein